MRAVIHLLRPFSFQGFAEIFFKCIGMQYWLHGQIPSAEVPRKERFELLRRELGSALEGATLGIQKTAGGNSN